MKTKQINIKILYISLHNLLKRKYGCNRIVDRRLIFCDLGKHFLIPKNVRPLILKELESMQLVEWQTKNNILVKDLGIDLEQDAGRLYQLAGLTQEA